MAKRKPKPLKLGQYEPLPFSAILSPDGKFYRAEDWKHEHIAGLVTGKLWDDLLKQGWLRISSGLVHRAFIWKEPTQAQIDALDDYANFMEWSLPNVFDTLCRPRARKFLGLES